ncbi:hypothetical protein [Kitasatospora sp. NPDC057541]|uniref:hypothetical protein n=1 Tax=unclassified Kitasatospora TaxID=2633591 RepID=UPI003678959E
MFGQLDQAVQKRKPSEVRALLAQVDAEAARDRTPGHQAIAAQAEALLKAHDPRDRWTWNADEALGAATARRARAARDAQQEIRTVRVPRPQSSRVDPEEMAHQRMKNIIVDLERRSSRLTGRELRELVDELTKEAKRAGGKVTLAQWADINWWVSGTDALVPRSAPQTPASGMYSSNPTSPKAAPPPQSPADGKGKRRRKR